MDCVLPPTFFQRPAAKAARDLLGKLCRGEDPWRSISGVAASGFAR